MVATLWQHWVDVRPSLLTTAAIRPRESPSLLPPPTRPTLSTSFRHGTKVSSPSERSLGRRALTVRNQPEAVGAVECPADWIYATPDPVDCFRDRVESMTAVCKSSGRRLV